MQKSAMLNAYGLSDTRGLYISDNNGNYGVVLGMFKSGGFVSVYSNDDRGAAMMCAEDSHGAVAVSKDDKVRALMSVEDSGGCLSIHDDKAKVKIWINKYGNGDIWRLDKYGNNLK
jgi:hypothetical protein